MENHTRRRALVVGASAIVIAAGFRLA